MSTRANIIFREKRDSVIGLTVYQHYDGYPTETVPNIIKALAKAWKLPRYEADEFATAFIAANKQDAGGFRFEGTWKEGDQDSMGVEWVYHVFFDTERKQLCVMFRHFDGPYHSLWIDEHQMVSVEISRVVKEETRVDDIEDLKNALSCYEE